MSRLLARVRHDEDGMSLTEVVVAMVIFSVVISVFMAAIVSWTEVTVRNNRVSDQTVESRRMYTSFDRNVMSAKAINRPVKVGNDWFIEILDEASAPKTCVQWVYRKADSTVATRSWPTGTPGPKTPTPWRVLAFNVQAPASSPFVMKPAMSNNGRQGLEINVAAREGDAPITETKGTFTARNSSVSSPSDVDANADGVSDTQVCSSDFSGWRS